MRYIKEYFLLVVLITVSFWGCKDDLINGLPSEGFWTNISPMNHTRWQPQAVLLSNSQVLVTGGNLYEGGIRYSCEIYNPQTNSWSFTDSLPQYVNSHLILLANGDVLSLASGGAIGGQCLIYNYGTKKWN